MRLRKILGLIVGVVMLFSTTVFAESSYSLDQKRIFGKDRYETSSLISKNGWESASSVVICNGENFPDALCAAPLAKKYNAPILLTSKSGLSESTKEELSRLNPDKVIIIGGNGVIPDKVISEIKTAAPKASDVTRLGGTTRYDTSKMIADKVGESSSIVLVSGKASSDALSISYIAANKGMPILLADRKEDVSEYSKNNSVEKTYIIGGESLVSRDIESIFKNTERIYGKDRYESNQKILDKFKDDINFVSIYLASAQYNGVDQFADALSVSALASKDCNPIILVSGTMNKDAVSIIKSKVDKNSKVIAIGGTQLVSENIVTALVNVNSSNENDNQGNSGSSGGGGGGGSSSSNPFAGGNGTVSSPYKIATAAQLNKVRSYLNKNFILTADIDLSSYANWEPIGAFKPLSDKPEDAETPDPKAAFRGSFNGNGHTISNLKIDRKDMAIGLFGCITQNENKSNVIHNLIVKNVNVTGYSDLVGGVIGHQAAGSPIEKIELIGDNKITGNDKSANVGGIVGGTMDSNITDCKAEADIVINGDGNNLVGILAGGLGNCSLSGCSAKGSITVNGKEAYSIGGLAGCVHEGAYVKDCSSDVTISVAEKDFMIGGLIGHAGTFDESNPTVISNCTVKADIKAPESASRIGGVVGSGFYIDGFEYYPAPSVYTVENCSIEGSITGGTEVGTVAGYAYNSTVKNCTSTMTIDGNADGTQIGKSDTEASLFAGGSGTEADPYQIATASQFNRVRRYLNKNYILTADIDLSSYENWEPIGVFKPVSEEDGETPVLSLTFSGTFDGSGHKISNIHISRDNDSCVGLFGCVSGDNASIKNFVIENISVSGDQLVGGAIGYAALKNSVESVSLIGENSIKGGFLVGGVIGGGFCDTKNCSANANVTLVGDDRQGAGVLAGGMEDCSLIGCRATGTITAVGSGNYSIGGLSGAAQKSPSVEDCNADVTITVGENSSMVGGLIGSGGTYDIENPTLIKNCSANASIKAVDSAEKIGGIMGGSFYLDADKDNRPVPTVYKVVDSKTSGSIEGGKIVGTIAGYAYNSTVENCTSTMTVNGNSNAQQIGKSETAEPSLFAGGSGTESDPYQIATASQLNNVRKYLDKHFKLTSDIDLSSYESWEPIGTFKPLSEKEEDAETPDPKVAFRGTFNGNGHTISNIKINRPQGFASGLFGCTVGTQENPSSIYNLTVENADVIGGYLVGGMIGLQHKDCTVENISLTGNNKIQGLQGVGGIVGTSFEYIKDCNAIADIIVLGNDGACAGVIAGGTDSSSLINCTAAGGSVTAKGDNCWALGGLSGAVYAAEEVTNCHADNVIITSSGQNNRLVGGLVGFTGTYGQDRPTSVINCSANTTINASSNTTCIGGLVGGSSESSTETIPSSFAIKDCTTTGTIVGGSESVGSITGYVYNSTVENCTSTMTVNGSADAPQIGKSETAEPSLFAGGSGTEADPYQIATASQLNNVRKYLDKHFKLTADIDLSSYENWEPIGTFDPQAEDEAGYFANAFKGSFDGDNHIISNMTTNKEDAVGVGLIGVSTSSSMVKNLKMENVKAKGTMAVAAVVGYNQGTAENLTLSGDNDISGYNCIGGILGGNEGGAIKNCTSAATINVLGDNVFENGKYILPDNAECGGIIVGGSFGGTIGGCSAEGTVNSKGRNAMGLGGVGGCLENMESIINCNANVTINAGESAHGVGGLCGFSGTFDKENPAKISNCKVSVAINGKGATHTGGLIGTGLYMNKYNMESVFIISGCEVNATINDTVTPGTVAGRAEGSIIESCTANVTIDGKSDGPKIGITDRLFESAE